MNKRGHQIGCIISSALAIYLKKPIMIPGIILGSFLPDLDCRSGSYIRSKLPWLGKLYNLLPKNKIFGRNGYNHRSLLLHSYILPFILLVMCWKYHLEFLLGLVLGWIVHLILDR